MRIGKFESDNFEGKISGLNVWESILSHQEVRKMALQSCDDSAGSCKDWYEIKSALNPEKYHIIVPSICKTTHAKAEKPKPAAKKNVLKNVLTNVKKNVFLNVPH